MIPTALPKVNSTLYVKEGARLSLMKSKGAFAFGDRGEGLIYLLFPL